MDTRSSRWAFTAYEQQWSIFDNMPPIVADAGWQIEVAPDTGRKHYQGYLKTSSTQRFAAMKKAFPGVHLEVAKNWSALVAYCNKKDTAVPDSQKVYKSEYMNKFQFLEYLMKQIANNYNWRDMLMDEIERLVVRLGNEYIIEGHTYVAWILSDPNFILTIRRSGRALLLSYEIGRTDGRPE